MTKITRSKRAVGARKADTIREQAAEIVQHFSFHLRIEADSPVYAGKMEHLECEDGTGHWVQVYVFVPKDPR
jgi:hypothetical protein